MYILDSYEIKLMRRELHRLKKEHPKDAYLKRELSVQIELIHSVLFSNRESNTKP